MAYLHSTEINAGNEVNAITFTQDGEYLIGGGEYYGIEVWQARGGKQVARIPAKSQWILCVAVSKDGRYIAAGSLLGELFVWEATTYKQVLAVKMGIWAIRDVDFSPDSTHLVSVDDRTATIWDITAHQKVQTLTHSGTAVGAAKYAPQGDKIATANPESVRVWDSDNGRLLVDIKVEAKPLRGLLWFNDHLFVKTKDSKIRRIDASTGSTISEWSVPHGHNACITLPQHGKFVAYSTSDGITFWDTSTHVQLGLIPGSGSGHSIAFSPSDHLLAVVGKGGKIVLRGPSIIKEPKVYIDNVALDAWKHGQLTEAEVSLTAAGATSTHGAHYVLASRALVRARLRRWDAALVDAEKSIKIHPSVIGYIAKCAALVGMDEMGRANRVCDIAFHFYPDHALFLLLIKAVILFMAGEHEDAISRIDDLITVRFFDPTLYVLQAYMFLLLGNLHMESGDYVRALQSFDHARATLGDCKDRPPLIVLLISGWKFDDLAVTIQQRSCEALLSTGRTNEARESVLHMVNRRVNMSESTKRWVSEFIRRCLCIPENGDNTIRGLRLPNNAQMPQQQSHASHPVIQLLRVWARFSLSIGTWNDALAAAAGFILPRFTIYQVMCERLEMIGRVPDAVSCLHQMHTELDREMDGELVNWTQGFKSRCFRKLEALGDIAMNSKGYDEAISQFTIALSLDLTGATPRDLLDKRSKAHIAKGEWNDALNDANDAIKLDPSSPFGYESKHAALRGAGYYANAIDAFKTMLSKISESSDPVVREQIHRYITPEQTEAAIRATIKQVIRDSPAVLINVMSGRLCDKAEQAAIFESMPVFTELIASMTTHIKHDLIERVVGQFYRYATFSHTWEGKEPLFEKVTKVLVYDLEASPTHQKLQMFCKIVRDAGFSWAWSDTCCIDKTDHVVLQEALISMFKWYEGSTMTIIFLRGVGRLAQRGAMMRSLWNSRGWTLQEYHASKVVRFYTEDWTPYLGLEIYNHKDSPEIISEMEEATGISAQALMTLRPGLDEIREKLSLASSRQTTRVEDAAYSLLGIFSISLPIAYGEGDTALGRLLAQLLTNSGDASILAWTGKSGGFNSCLPANNAVFHQSATSHIPPPIIDADVGIGATGSHVSSQNLPLFTALYDRVNRLSVASFAGCRMKLPCLAFKLGRISTLPNTSPRVFRAKTTVLGIVEIRTEEDLSQLDSLCLIHPWIDFLLNRQPVGGIMGTMIDENVEDQSSELDEPQSFPDSSNMPLTTRRTPRAARLINRLRTFNRRPALPDLPLLAPPYQFITSTLDTASLLPPSTLSPTEKEARVLQFIARLRQPFGALLLAPNRLNVDEYKRVATESLITVQVDEPTPELLDKLIRSVRMLDVL